MMRKILFVIILFLIMPAPLHAEWKKVKEGNGITIFTQQKEGEKIYEVKGVYTIKSSSKEVYRVINDLDNYKEFMPYTKVSRVIGKKDSGTVFYSLIDAPLVSKRDYIVLLTPEFDADGVKEKIRVSWKPANELGPPKEDGVIRVEKNEGYWLLEPVGESETKVTYYLYTDPGGKIADWIVNTANKKSVPDILKAVEKRVKN